MTLKVIRNIHEIRNIVNDARSSGKTTCVVPTMGGLHKGHLSLVEKAGDIADFVVVTIFVNPTQFNNPDDFSSYPGDEDTDIRALSESAANVVFAPSPDVMYPSGFATSVTVNAANGILCDKYRPGHFDGVATVVTKLFLQTGTEYACFGEKDYQQLFIIKQLTKDLDIPIEIVPVETVREADGLALSSRNARLSAKHRKQASQLNKAMQDAASRIRDGLSPADACELAVKNLQASGDFEVEYLEVRAVDTLELSDPKTVQSRLFAAAWLDGVRLIDNIAI